MAHLLDTQATYKKLDPDGAGDSVTLLAEQCLQAWSEAGTLNLPKSYKGLDRIVVCGMGGSGLGAHMVKSIFGPEMKVPFEVLNDYTLPRWVNNRTLVLAVTYSGGTEEALTMFKEAVKRKAKTVAITSGGKLAAAAKRAKVPAYVFDDSKTNPARMPRMGVGLTLFSELRILKDLGYIKLSNKDVKMAAVHMMNVSERWAVSVPHAKNAAKKLAVKLTDTMPTYVASEHLVGNTITARNQTHETAKCYSEWYAIPELNHHLLEGLSHPEVAKHLAFVQFTSKLYHKRNQKRHEITREVLKKNGLKVHPVAAEGSTRLEQALFTLQFTAALNYYLGMIYNVDPSKIPWVDMFKKRLG